MQTSSPTILDCGHPEDEGRPANVNGKIVQGWRSVLTDDGKRICHACADKRILDCGHNPSPHFEFTTGYGTTGDGKRLCYDCIGKLDRQAMIDDGKATLYLTEEGPHRLAVGNWPGSFRIPVNYYQTSVNNWGAKRTDVWFNGPDGHVWYGAHYGESHQLINVKRTKERWQNWD